MVAILGRASTLTKISLRQAGFLTQKQTGFDHQTCRWKRHVDSFSNLQNLPATPLINFDLNMFGWCSIWAGSHAYNSGFRSTRNRCWETCCTWNLDFNSFSQYTIVLTPQKFNIAVENQHFSKEHPLFLWSVSIVSHWNFVDFYIHGDPNLQPTIFCAAVFPSFPAWAVNFMAAFLGALPGEMLPGWEVRVHGSLHRHCRTWMEKKPLETWKLPIFGNAYLKFINFHQASAHPQSSRPV